MREKLTGDDLVKFVLENVNKKTLLWSFGKSISAESPEALAYKLIKYDVLLGYLWAKCQNCGNPFLVGLKSAGMYHCSNECYDEAIENLNKQAGRALPYVEDW